MKFTEHLSFLAIQTRPQDISNSDKLQRKTNLFK